MEKMRYILIIFCLILVGCTPEAPSQEAELMVDSGERYCGDGLCEEFENCLDCPDDCECVNETIS